jgi:AcrR family transcriptional regulator
LPRPSRLSEKRRELLPVVARAFATLGYRRATTAELARRCRVQENILYRLWPDKKAMFVAAIEYVHALAAETWQRVLQEPGDGLSPAQRLLRYEAIHLGEFGHHRIILMALSETDDADIRDALARMYRAYQRTIEKYVAAHRSDRAAGRRPARADDRIPAGGDAALTAWALIGLGTISTIARELDLLGERSRRKLVQQIGETLL